MIQPFIPSTFQALPWPCVPQAEAQLRFVSPIISKEEKRGKTALNERAVKTNVLRDKSAALVLAPVVKSARLGKIMMQLGESLWLSVIPVPPWEKKTDAVREMDGKIQG